MSEEQKGKDKKNVVKQLFKWYYSRYASKIRCEKVEKREFGFMLFDKDVMIRHKSFKSVDELREFMIKIVPKHAYHSIAMYKRPEAPMEEKGWISAELLFDIDADHAAEKYGIKMSPETYPQCMSIAAEETIKLIEDFLLTDFGLSTREIDVLFSGGRGFHVHVKNEEFSSMDRVMRQEIVDYITGNGINLKATTVFEGYFCIESHGWIGRLSRGVYEVLQSGYFRTKLKKQQVEAIEKRRSKILDEMLTGFSGTWSELSEKTRKKILELAVELMKGDVDRVVTSDISRLTRILGTLHGKTGFKVMRVDIDKLEEFDPTEVAIALPMDIQLTAKVLHNIGEINFGGSRYGPYKKGTIVTLPSPIAVFLSGFNSIKLLNGGILE